MSVVIIESQTIEQKFEFNSIILLEESLYEPLRNAFETFLTYHFNMVLIVNS
jgi:hypothetical protein